MPHEKSPSIALTLLPLVGGLLLVACERAPSAGSTVSGQQATASSPTASSSGTEAADPIVPSGWKTVTEGIWTFSVPDDWVGGGMYHPEGAISSSGLPNIFCVTGVRGLSEAGVVDDNLRIMIGFGSMTKTPMTVCGQDGYLAEGSEGLALFYAFEPRDGDGADTETAIRAVWCTAPSSSRFSQYEAVFRHAIESVECSAD